MEIFKAYDVRGIYPEDLNEEIAYKIGRSLVRIFKAESVVVGRDMRLSSPEVAAAFLRGVKDEGGTAIDTGRCTTPMNYFAVAKYGYSAAAMITASHNPSQWTGFKFCRSNAVPVSYQTGGADIEKEVTGGDFPPVEKPTGKVELKEIFPDYLDFLMEYAKDLKPLKVVADTGNGMEGEFIEKIFEKLPCELSGLYLVPDGSFPNHEPNPLKNENMRDLQKAVIKEKADLGLAFDGDADRCAFVDETGAIVPGDMVTALFAREMLESNPGATIAYDLRSSLVVAEEITAAGGTPVETRVGHSFIKALMREKDAVMAGELSGHFYFKDAFFTDNADFAMLTMMRLMSKKGKKLSELVAPLRRYVQTGEINFEVEDKDAKIKELAGKFDDAEVYYLDGITVRYDDWWFNVRKSNTEPLLRLNLEAKTAELMEQSKAKVEAILKG